MSRPTRRRTHGRKRTHKRGSGVGPSAPTTLPGISRKTDPKIIAAKLAAEKAARNAEDMRRQHDANQATRQPLEFSRQYPPVKRGGDPSGEMEQTTGVQNLDGGAKHEHAVTIVVDYSKDGKSLTESEKKKLLKHIKTNHYYHGALKGKNSMKHEDTATHTRVSVLWKNGKLHKNGEDWDRVHELLTEELPHGIKAKHVHTE